MPNEPAAPIDTTLPELTEADKFVLQWLEENAPLMQDENGIDLGRIRENLKLTTRQRLEKAEQGAASLFFIKQARQRIKTSKG